jgi:hypothetical protein
MPVLVVGRVPPALWLLWRLVNLWVARLNVSRRTAEKINSLHSMTEQEVRSATAEETS